jgi:hypothetical protein
MPRPPLRRIVPLAVLACATIVVAAATGRRRGTSADPPDTRLAEAMMDDLATAEGMPEAPPA